MYAFKLSYESKSASRIWSWVEKIHDEGMNGRLRPELKITM